MHAIARVVNGVKLFVHWLQYYHITWIHLIRSDQILAHLIAFFLSTSIYV